MTSQSNSNYRFLFIANAALKEGLSGSDRIFQELARRWARKGYSIEIAVWEDGINICTQAGLLKEKEITLINWNIGIARNLPFLLNYFYRIGSGIFYALTTKLENKGEKYIIYNCSDFWQDSIPAFILKIKFPKSKLIGSFYLTAPNPFKGFNEGKGISFPTLKSILYWLQQQPVLILTKKLADIVYVTSEPDSFKFKHPVIVKGGVILDNIKYRDDFYKDHTKEFDAVFIGRFHPQKGVIQLIKIWNMVVKKKPEAKLIMIGDGPLMSEVKKLIQNYNLQANVILKGFMYDGEDKYDIYKKSKLVLHPAIYDSGGMASVEAMAWGVPGISFDLQALRSYYPKGIAKVPLDDLAGFANEILKLTDSENKDYYSKLSTEARDLALEDWDWDKRAQKILDITLKYI